LGVVIIYEGVSSYRIITNPDDIDRSFGTLSPFNIKNDFKRTGVDEKYLAENIAALIKSGTCGSYVELRIEYFKKKKITYSKMRLEDQDNNKGKSGGLRVIVLIDHLDHLGIPLHIFSKSEKDNISKKEINELNNLLDEYVYSRYERENNE
jgi:hypothetical protein